MSYLAAAAAVLVFAIAFRRSSIVNAAKESLCCSKEALQVLRSRQIPDDEKEERMKSASVRLFKQCWAITWRGAALLSLALLPIAVFDVAGLAPFASSAEAILSWQVLLGGTLTFFLLNYRSHS